MITSSSTQRYQNGVAGNKAWREGRGSLPAHNMQLTFYDLEEYIVAYLVIPSSSSRKRRWVRWGLLPILIWQQRAVIVCEFYAFFASASHKICCTTSLSSVNIFKNFFSVIASVILMISASSFNLRRRNAYLFLYQVVYHRNNILSQYFVMAIICVFIKNWSKQCNSL